LFRKFLSRSLSLPLFVSLSQVHKTALERVEHQGNLAKQKAEDATNKAQEGLREAKATQLLAQVPLLLLCPLASCCIANECVDVTDSSSLLLSRSVSLSLCFFRVCARALSGAHNCTGKG
jgi:hypothetical protein